MFGSGLACFKLFSIVSEKLLICVFVTGLNPYLTLNTANSGTILIDLSADDKEFQSVEEEVLTHT